MLESCNHHGVYRAALGFSFTEVLISVFISSLMLTGLFQAYLSTKAQYQHLAIELEEQQEQLLLGGWLRHLIQQAGYHHCYPLGNKSKQVAIFDALDPNLPASISKSALTNSKVLQVSQTVSARHIKQIAKGSELIKIHKPIKLKVGDKVIIADCHQKSLASIAALNSSKTELVLTKPVVKHFDKRAKILRQSTLYFFIKKAKGKAALYMKQGAAQQVVSHEVQNLNLNVLAEHQQTKLMQLDLKYSNQQLISILATKVS